MNSVIEHLLARKNKKVPVNDGRKIVMILFGGAMAGVRGAGSIIALEELGLTDAFDEIYASSAGFANASYFLSKQGKFGTSIYYEDLSGRKFINLYRLWKVADANYLVQTFCKTKPLNVKNIHKCKTKLFAQVKNSHTKKNVFLDVHKYPLADYFKILGASTRMPYLCPGSIKLGKCQYKDILLESDWLALVKQAFKSKATDYLIIYNHHRQYAYMHEKLDFTQFNGNICEIYPKPDWKLTRIETRPKMLKQACKQMGNLVKKAFGSSEKISLLYKPQR